MKQTPLIEKAKDKKLYNKNRAFLVKLI